LPRAVHFLQTTFEFLLNGQLYIPRHRSQGLNKRFGENEIDGFSGHALANSRAVLDPSRWQQ
jgi:hypothetical protein